MKDVHGLHGLKQGLLPFVEHRSIVSGAFVFQVLNFLDAYSDYNQIKMYPLAEEKTAFMMKGPNYYY
ncbi:hypothetical protein CR513_08994, partial [Mucuna pruriens]